MAKRKPAKPEDRIDIELPGKDGKKVKAYYDKTEINEFGQMKCADLLCALNETPLDNRLIVLEDTPASVSKGGIILPEESKTKPYTGVVVAIGPQVEVVKLHDQVRYPKRAGEQIEIDSKEYLMLRETDCYTILNK